MFYSEHPFTGLRVSEQGPLSDQEALRILGLAVEAGSPWGRLTLSERSESLLRVASGLQKERKALALLAGEEMGKPFLQGLAEVDKCMLLCRYIAGHAAEWLAGRSISEEDLQARVLYQPLGVVLGVMPWNFPYWQILRFAIPALMAGNTVMIKPAPQMLRTSRALQDIFDQAFPLPGICSHLLIDIHQLPLLLDTGLIAGVALTGSERAGASFAALAGARLIPAILELGGSDAFLVLEDADLNMAVRTAVRSRMANNGQTCLAAKRLLVHESKAEAFAKAFEAETNALAFGPPEDSKAFFTCLARTDLADNLQAQIDDALASGARLRWKADRGVVPRTHFAPLVLDNIHREMRVWKEEVFGPVAVIQSFRSEEEGLAMANDTVFGLGASVWTRDPDMGLRFAEALRTGTVTINGHVRSDPRLPFGGIRRSGFGRELGPEGMYAFCNVKSVITDSCV
jgi:succinate-semialdehyde dehydrogenase / glutarate-semialdehyde dehydrogenase